MDKNTPFVALDLEFAQPSKRIIQVGVAIGSLKQPEDEWIVRQWLLDPLEPVSEFITGLTGITDQDIAEKAVPWSQMAQELGALLYECKPFVNPVTWGGGDIEALLSALRERCTEFPYFGRRWVDVKTTHTFLMLAKGKNPSGGLRSAMAAHKVRFEGEQHRAHVDAFNTLRLFFRLLERQECLDSMAMLAKNL